MFSQVHFLALTCDEQALAQRLRARPAWRGSDEVFIQQQIAYQWWLLEASTNSEFDPPLVLLDTTNEPT